MASRQPSGNTRSAPNATASSSNIRRNLFPSARERRPNAAGASADSLQLSSEDVRPEASKRSRSNDDVVVWDEHGSLQMLERPELPELIGVEQDEVTQEQRAADARLIEMYRGHSRHHVDQSELRSAIDTSLQEKVASLDEDNWMYEEEVDKDMQR